MSASWGRAGDCAGRTGIRSQASPAEPLRWRASRRRAEMAEMSAQHQREMLAATQIIRDLETRLEKMAGQVQVLTRQLETLGH